MAHYAFIDANNVVTQVIVGRDENDLANGVLPWETFYGDCFGQTCKRTSYNTFRYYEPNQNGQMVFVESRHANGGTPFRGQYAAIGDIYNAELDEFVTPTKEQNNE